MEELLRKMIRGLMDAHREADKLPASAHRTHLQSSITSMIDFAEKWIYALNGKEETTIARVGR